MSGIKTKCAWWNCEVEFETTPEVGKRFCSPSHKNRYRAAKNKHPSNMEAVSEHVWNSSGYTFAKAMQRAEELATGHHVDIEETKTLMMNALRKRVDNYFAELEADAM